MTPAQKRTGGSGKAEGFTQALPMAEGQTIGKLRRLRLPLPPIPGSVLPTDRRVQCPHCRVQKRMNVYLGLTHKFNRRRARAILAGGQAVVLHRLAMMSKDGDWILREDAQTMDHVLSVLGQYGARYRFGAPLDVRWMAGGWSAHLEFQ